MGSSRSGDRSFYTSKICLAPMVRAGRTPLRLLSLDYGADLAYTEEIIDQKLLGCTRKENTILGTIDYCIEDDVVLRVASAREKDKCILQIGTNNGESAAAVARMIGEDVAAIDVNMGCPKSFSIAGGMGAALLTQTDKVKQILSSLVATSSVPVSCKIRLLDDPSATAALLHEIEKTGVAAVGVHGRRREERPRHPNREEEIREAARLCSIPVIANGSSAEIACRADIEAFRDRTGASSVMVARAALACPSVFREEGVLPMEQDIKSFLQYACEFDENYTMCKYVIQRMLGSDQEYSERGRQTVQAGSVLEICRAWGEEQLFLQARDSRRCAREKMKGKRKLENDEATGVEFVDVTFPLKRLRAMDGEKTPKCVLNSLCDEWKKQRPSYICRMRPSDRRFEAEIQVCDRRFTSRIGQTSKKMAEQVAALAALIGLDERRRLDGEWEELCQ